MNYSHNNSNNEFNPSKRFSRWLQEQQDNGFGKTCKCGRDINPARPHCPICGSISSNASKSGSAQLPTGEWVIAVRFKCRRCAGYFTDISAYLNCEAPSFELSKPMKQVRQETKVTSTLQKIGLNSIDEFKEKLLALRAKREEKEEDEE